MWVLFFSAAALFLGMAGLEEYLQLTEATGLTDFQATF
jgi:hypothetical protein